MSCTDKDKYTSKGGSCCDRCPEGKYVQNDCSGTEETKCVECGRGLYTATKNHLYKCHVCKDCNHNNKQRKENDCTATKDTVCACLTGFYCSNDDCDHCEPVARCHLGEGVKFQATRINNTICAPCEDGTFSNVTDFISPCKAHTRCEDYGRVLKTPGTPTTDAICGDFKSHCSWMLPAGLWSGLVLTIFVVLVLIIWRAKRKSYKAVRSIVPVAVVDFTTVPPPTPPELSSHCQETCTMDDCKLSIFKPDDTPVNCVNPDSLDGSRPITPLKASVSFVESQHINGKVGYCSGNLLRSFSEPQEDEWCGT